MACRNKSGSASSRWAEMSYQTVRRSVLTGAVLLGHPHLDADRSSRPADELPVDHHPVIAPAALPACRRTVRRNDRTKSLATRLSSRFNTGAPGI